MKILMLVDWQVARLEQDRDDIQAPDKLVRHRPYWFFRHWPDSAAEVDVLDIGQRALLNGLESRVLHFYVTQSLLAYLKRKKYDLIISHSARSALVLAFLRALSGERSPLHVVIDVGCFNGGRDNRGELHLIKTAGKSLGGVIAHSSVQAGYYDRHLPQLPYRFVPFGVDAEHFSPRELPAADYVLSFGSRARDYPTLIKAWQKLPRGATRLRIIGADSAAGAGSGEGIDFLGRVPLATLMSNIAAARLVVIPLPLLNYSYGQMSFLQSMAMGKACVVTRTPSTVDYLTDQEDALLVKPYECRDLAEKIAALLEDSTMNERIARKARQSIEQSYNESNMARGIHDFIAAIA